MRMAKAAAILLICVTLAAGAACGDGGGGGGGGAKPTGIPVGETFHVSPNDTGKELTLDVGDVVVMTLDCDISAGYHWYLLDEGNRSVMRRIAYEALLTRDPGELPAYVHTYQAHQAGSSYVHFVCNRSLELDPVPAATFNLSVTVR